MVLVSVVALYVGIHPLSIEAISPAWGMATSLVITKSIHPLSIEAISPAWDHGQLQSYATRYPSSVNRGYFSCKAVQYVLAHEVMGIHPLSIEAISPAR